MKTYTYTQPEAVYGTYSVSEYMEAVTTDHIQRSYMGYWAVWLREDGKILAVKHHSALSGYNAAFSKGFVRLTINDREIGVHMGENFSYEQYVTIGQLCGEWYTEYGLIDVETKELNDSRWYDSTEKFMDGLSNVLTTMQETKHTALGYSYEDGEDISERQQIHDEIDQAWDEYNADKWDDSELERLLEEEEAIDRAYQEQRIMDKYNSALAIYKAKKSGEYYEPY